MSPQGTEYFTKLDAAGQIPTTTNNLLYQALQLLAPGHPARTYVQQAAEANSGIGKRLEDLESFGRKAFPEPNAQPDVPGLRPGERIADAGSLSSDQGDFDGTLNPTLMSRDNWGYYSKHNLGAHSGHMFDRPFTIGDPATGSTYDQGTLANAENTADPIVRDAQGNQVADLSTFG